MHLLKGGGGAMARQIRGSNLEGENINLIKVL